MFVVRGIPDDDHFVDGDVAGFVFAVLKKEHPSLYLKDLAS